MQVTPGNSVISFLKAAWSHIVNFFMQYMVGREVDRPSRRRNKLMQNVDDIILKSMRDMKKFTHPGSVAATLKIKLV